MSAVNIVVVSEGGIKTMKVFTRTLFFLVFGVMFLIFFGVAVFLVDIPFDLLMNEAASMDWRFGAELNMFRNGMMLMGVLFIIIGVINYFVGVSSEETDEYVYK